MTIQHYCEFDPLWWYLGKPFCGCTEWHALTTCKHEVTCPDCLKMLEALQELDALAEAE